MPYLKFKTPKTQRWMISKGFKWSKEWNSLVCTFQIYRSAYCVISVDNDGIIRAEAYTAPNERFGPFYLIMWGKEDDSEMFRIIKRTLNKIFSKLDIVREDNKDDVQRKAVP